MRTTTTSSKTLARRARRVRPPASTCPSSRAVPIASRDELTALHINQILKVGEFWKSAEDSDVVLFDNYTPQGFTVKALLQGEESCLWIGIPSAEPKNTRPMVIIQGDALRRMMTDFLKHLKSPIFGGAR
jgi:hypothetical protein